MVEFNPTHEVREGVDLVWQIPPNPRGILFIAHSAGGSPFSFWPPHPNVPQCTGTPEHKLLAKDALTQGFALLAGKSVEVGWQSWPVPTVDTDHFEKILKEWPREHGLEHLPLSGLGSSSGGTFMACLATVVKFHSIVIMISAGRAEAFESAVPEKYPATLFVPMTGDDKTMPKVKQAVEILKAKGIPCAIQEAPPLKVDPHFLAEYIDELDLEQATKLHSLFVEHDIVAEDNSLNTLLINDDVEPYLRKAEILPTVDDSQRQQDEEKLEMAKKSKAERPSKPGGGRHFAGGPTGGRHSGGPTGGRHSGGPTGGRHSGGPTGGRHSGGPTGGRHSGGPTGGRHFAGGPPGGGPFVSGPHIEFVGPPCHPLAAAVSNQLKVAQGNHTLTARHDKEIFAWLEGKGWPASQPQ